MKRGGKGRVQAFRTRTAAETFALAERMAGRFTGREVVLLRGELGAGKTVFAQGLAAGSGVPDLERVCSPTYTLVNVYQGRWTVYHIDLYRLETARQVEDLGWADFLGEGVVVVEWAEKVPFPLEGITVEIAVADGDARRILIRDP
ncbi:MAG: tRNA (adenosine(37)-N6)-threonylcarbamoyltransferase complex ATPase subunit type 1 TsaE [Candidatus Aminicenantes bacterium]|nr:tRNA (adenosine(37)-N6)-threonylcarbamoyltransferase complex ATPase subunit type 1 TsaE [Candidatus Aminicenantes bacterium]